MSEPLWTRGRLAALLGEFYGRGPRGGVNVVVAAAELQVSTRRVQRWLAGGNDQPAAIPTEQLRALTTGGERTERRAEGKAAYSRNALIEIALPKGVGIKQVWRDSGWLGDHIVLLVQVHDRPWHQLMLTKRGQAADMARARGEILDQVTVPSKFAGDVLIYEAMHRQAPWAVRPPKSALPIGNGQVWAEDAPNLDLSALAVEIGLR